MKKAINPPNAKPPETKINGKKMKIILGIFISKFYLQNLDLFRHLRIMFFDLQLRVIKSNSSKCKESIC